MLEFKSISMEKKVVLFTRDASGWFKWLAIVMVILSHYAEWWSWFTVEEGTSELVRFALSRFGPYGVAIFLLFSGYGLAKSAGNQRIGIKFILKRVIGVYIPYLVMVLLIEGISGGLQTWEDFSDIWYGHNFWYMTVLFSFYLAFMAIWLIFVNRNIRAVLIAVFTYVYCNYLYQSGQYDFWYISNIAFAIGVFLALYEPEFVKINNKIKIVLAMIFGIASGYVVYSALYIEHIWEMPIEEIRYRILAVTVFTLFIAFFASVWCFYDPVGKFLGKYSLYLYLSHTFLFMWTINYFDYEMGMRFIVAILITLVVSVLIGMMVTKICDSIYIKMERIVDFKRKKG